MRKTPTKVVEKGDNNNLKSNVKKAATVLVAALGLTVATSQDVNTQLFKGRDLKKQIEQNKKVKAHNNETIAEQNEVKANNEKIIAGLRADLGKDSKNPLKSNRSSFAYNSTPQKNDSKIGRDPNN